MNFGKSAKSVNIRLLISIIYFTCNYKAHLEHTPCREGALLQAAAILAHEIDATFRLAQEARGWFAASLALEFAAACCFRPRTAAAAGGSSSHITTSSTQRPVFRGRMAVDAMEQYHSYRSTTSRSRLLLELFSVTAANTTITHTPSTPRTRILDY